MSSNSDFFDHTIVYAERNYIVNCDTFERKIYICTTLIKYARKQICKLIDELKKDIDNNSLNILVEVFTIDALLLKAKEKSVISQKDLSYITNVGIHKISKIQKMYDFSFKDYSNINITIPTLIKYRNLRVG